MTIDITGYGLALDDRDHVKAIDEKSKDDRLQKNQRAEFK